MYQKMFDFLLSVFIIFTGYVCTTGLGRPSYWLGAIMGIFASYVLLKNKS